MEHVDGPSGISVVGTGRVSVPPEIATLSLGVSVEETSLDAARSAAATKTTAARDHLLAAGVADRDVQTSRLNVHDSHDRQLRRQTFHVATGLTAVFRELATAESVVNELFSVVGEGLDMHGLTFGVEDPEAGREQALTLAFEDARRKAALLAGLAGAALGSVLAISQSAGRSNEPRRMGRAMMTMAAEPAEIPVEGGELEVVATVEVRWALEG